MPPLARTEVIVPIRPASDGDASHRPAPHYTHYADARLPRERLALNWMKDRGEARLGVNYILDRMPAGYTFWGRPRPSHPNHIDKYVYGHPSGKPYDSPNRFYPHFLHLMQNGNAKGCPCVLCTGPPPKAKIPGMGGNGLDDHISNAAGEAPRRGRPPGTGRPSGITAFDDEGNPDVYRLLLNKLQRSGRLQEDIIESMSMDWQVERKLLNASLEQLRNQSRWIPRLGEVVLYVRDVGENEEILPDDESGYYKIYSSKTKELETPKWEAGVVTQVPEESLREEDLVKPQRKHADVNYSGFRIEPLPDPNGSDKTLSKRHKYAPLAHVRPFTFHQELLNGIAQAKLHETIISARRIMSTVTLISRYRFTGVWPKAKLACRGIYIGCELIIVGDFVRLFPKEDGDLPTGDIDIMEVTDIHLNFWDLDKASANDNDQARPYQSAIRIHGRCWTPQSQNPPASFTSVNPKSNGATPKALQDYGNYRLKHAANQKIEVPFTRILSRAYEATALGLWFPNSDPVSSFQLDNPQDMSLGLNGVRKAREFSSTTLRAITDDTVSGRRWFWADTRVEALDLMTVNGQEIALFDGERDIKEWRKVLKIMDGTAGPKELTPIITSSMRRFSMAVPSPANAMVMSAVEALESDEEAMMDGTVGTVEEIEADSHMKTKGVKRSLLDAYRNMDFSASKRSRSRLASETSSAMS